ncbi:MAG: type 4a pilus biogenesis protein PilO [Desulfotomaculum sp.]|nr:type 4a pilus biogenesis protein PilO [Desulfotomaculum sp.]
MNKLTPRERALLFVFAGAAAVYLLYSCLLQPQITEYINLSQEIQLVQQEIRKAAAASHKLDIEKDKAGDVRTNLTEITKLFARDITGGKMLVKLDRGAVNCGINIKELSPQSYIEKEYYLELPVDITVEGDYRGILNYLQWLENTADWSNYSEISQFVIEPYSNNNDSKNTVQGSFTLVFYSEKYPREELQVKEVLEKNCGRSNVFLPSVQYHFLHNSQQNGGQ